MADDLEGPEDDRAVELSAVSAIYPELIIDSDNPFSATIDIAVEPVNPLAIAFVPLENGARQTGLLTPSLSDDVENPVAKNSFQTQSQGTDPTDPTDQEIHSFTYLPPLTLKIDLQEGYPSRKPPLFHLNAQTPWIPAVKLEELREVGSSIWEDMGRDQVVFSYIDYLREAAERSFDLKPGDRICLAVSQNIKIYLLDFEAQLKRAKFEQETFECGICLGIYMESAVIDILLIMSRRTEEGSRMSSVAGMLSRVLRGMSPGFL